MSPSTLNIGIVGAGEFSKFATAAFLQVPGVTLTGVYDARDQAARAFARLHDCPQFSSLEALVRHPAIDLVYIATPPALHFEQSRAALLADKHVICEKPAALRVRDAEELAALARRRDRLYVVNLMQRYNPLFSLVRRLIEEKVFGRLLHGFFENYASDEFLSPAHWFWDRTQSGGIFIEHGVHFFDLFAGWFGPGKLESSMQWGRPGFGERIVDRVQATVRYLEGWVNFYHSFDQPKVLDRQEFRLQFERGDVTLSEWVPVGIRIHGLVTDADLEALQQALPGSTVAVHSLARSRSDTGSSPKFVAQGRFQTIGYDQLITLEHGQGQSKIARYEALLVALIEDQWQWIKDRTHIRVIDASNAVDSLRLAEEASSARVHICPED